MFGCGEMARKEEKVTRFKGQNSNCIFHIFCPLFSLRFGGLKFVSHVENHPLYIPSPSFSFINQTVENSYFSPNFPSPLFRHLPFQSNQINKVRVYIHGILPRDSDTPFVSKKIFMWRQFFTFSCVIDEKINFSW